MEQHKLDSLSLESPIETFDKAKMHVCEFHPPMKHCLFDGCGTAESEVGGLRTLYVSS